VIASDFMQVAEGLIRLDPIRTYPERGARLVASLINAQGYRLVFQSEDRKKKFDSTPPPPPDVNLVSFPLRHGRRVLGTIEFYLPEGSGKLEGYDLRLARWGARALAYGLSYANRLSRPEDGRRMAPEVRTRLEHSPLTQREKQVVSLLVAGASTRTIAQKSNLTVATVHTYLKRIYSKLGVHSRVELVARMAGTESSSPSAMFAFGGEQPGSKAEPN
jgi:DNA-binding CsgD family transcriptional regulator